ncbi:MAG: 3'-5' exonuclease [Burkholderiaceae bacterium]|nr:3'-5' exonuclease [Burkholderiaceae bacterium]
MPISEQLGFGFDGPAAEAAPKGAGRKPRAARRTPVAQPHAAPAPQVPTPAPGAVDACGDLEAMARALEQSPDYRVLRRLVPTLRFEREPLGPLAQVLVLDTETTGLDAGRDRVIELALLRVAVDTRTGLPVGDVQVYDGLEDPGCAIPAAITGITGISDDMVRGQRLDEERIAQLLQGVDLVVAHNAAFDRPFAEARIPAFGRLAWACSLTDVDWKALGQGSARLESLALACGLFYSAHRAETDCHALLSVLARPLTEFGAPASACAGNGDERRAAHTGLAQLLDAAGQIHHRLQATGAPFEAKDVLKARGYRWDAPQRVWGTTLRSDAALDAELQWLAQAVYAGHATRVKVASVDAQQRYSVRSGTPTLRLVAAGFELE